MVCRYLRNSGPQRIRAVGLQPAALGEDVMANDADWVADVRRWYFAGQRPARSQYEEPDSSALGYEAADPALQSPNWPDAPRGFERNEKVDRQPAAHLLATVVECGFGWRVAL